MKSIIKQITESNRANELAEVEALKAEIDDPKTKDKLSILALKVDENNLTSDDEQEIDLYRCLCHMKSNYNEPYEYNIETYEDSEYTNVELYNWYLEVNNIYDIKSDRYVNCIEACIETEIIHMNPLIWD